MFIEQRANLAASSGGATCFGWLTIDHAIHFAPLELWTLIVERSYKYFVPMGLH